MGKYYPVNLLVKDKRCVVAGAGIVAQRKVARLLECNADVLVVSPKITSALRRLAQKKRIIFKNRQVSFNDFKGAYLVIAATSDKKLNSAISVYCAKKGILINVVDSPKECSFILPSIVRRGDLTVAISTDGISPALAKKIRQEFERKFGAEYAKLLRLIKGIRGKAISKIEGPRARKAFFEKILKPGIMRLIKQNKEKQAKIKMEGLLKYAAVS